MNKKSTTVTISQKCSLRISTILSKTSIAFNFLFLAIVSATMISATINASAACSTPQFGLPIVLNTSRPVAAAPGDFNRDGNPDVAILKNNPGASPPGTVELFLGNGNNGFTSTGIQYNALTGAVIDLVAADFNNDGKLDIAATGTSPSAVAAILLGDGNGGFSPPTNFSAGGSPSSITFGDFNNDNNADIIIKSGVASVPSALLLPGLGNGSFGSPINIPTGNGGSSSITVRDFNNDGFLDFATVNTFNPQNVSIKLGNGSLIFSTPPAISVNSAIESTAGDFNGDGKQDLAIASGSAGDGNVRIYFGIGDGTFSLTAGSPYPLANFPRDIIAADFNSDNKTDVVTANTGNSTTTNTLSILLNNGTGGFGSAFNLSPETGASERVYPLDFNRNGTTDLVIVKEITQNKVVLLQNTCPPASRNNFPDFDSDGRADIAVFRPSNGTWYVNRSAQGNTQVQFGISTDKIVPADYDGDGRIDIALYRAEEGVWYILYSTTNTFRALLYGFPTDIPVPKDYDGDGKTELAVYRPSNGFWYVLNLANNKFTAFQFGISEDKPVAGDYDGDGRADYAVYRPSNGVWYYQRSTAGFGAIQFGIATDTPVAADYDGDGRTDVAVFRPSNGVWYLQRSTTGFSSIQFGLDTDKPVPADYDGDGKTDVAVYRPSNGVWYLQRSTLGFTGIQFGIAEDRPIPAAFVP